MKKLYEKYLTEAGIGPGNPGVSRGTGADAAMLQTGRKIKRRIPKNISKITKNGERLSKELSKWFAVMNRNLKDMDDFDISRIMNAEGRISAIAKGIGIR